jgi:urea transporter
MFGLALLLPALAIIPGAALSHFLATRGLNGEIICLLAIALPIVGIIVVAHLRRMFWACPRCGRAFHVTWWFGNAFARRCVHCGLPKWSPIQKPA